MTHTPYQLVPVPRSGTRTAEGFMMSNDGRCTQGAITIPDYPRTPEAENLRGKRIQLGMTLRMAAAALGLTPVQLGEVERGQARPASPADWGRMMAQLERAAREVKP